MHREANDEGLQEVKRKVAVVLEQLVELLGPRDCPHGKWEECYEDDCFFNGTRPVQGLMNDWVVLTNWTRMEDGSDMTSMTMGPNQPDHHTNGLLHDGLYHH